MKRILIITGGMAPAVVTETIWALVRQRVPAFVPDRIVIAVTADTAPLYRDKLFGSQGKLALLSHDLAIPGLALQEISTIEATECKDIRSAEHAIEFGDLVCRLVQEATADPDTLVHVSLAGGRKTMSFQGGAALSLFGRPQDELSHVLVHPHELERADFWWPGHTKAGAVELATIPFIRVRRRIDARLLEQRMDYARYVTQVNASIEGRTGVVLELIASTCTLRIADGSTTIRLEPADFRVYRVLAEWAKVCVPGAGPDGVGGNHCGWITAQAIREPHLSRPNPIRRLIALGGSRRTYSPDTSTRKDDGTTPNAAFGQAVARVKTAIRSNVLDEVLATRLLGDAKRAKGVPARFGIGLASHEIIIRETENGPDIDPTAASSS